MWCRCILWRRGCSYVMWPGNTLKYRETAKMQGKPQNTGETPKMGLGTKPWHRDKIPRDICHQTFATGGHLPYWKKPPADRSPPFSKIYENWKNTFLNINIYKKSLKPHTIWIILSKFRFFYTSRLPPAGIFGTIWVNVLLCLSWGGGVWGMYVCHTLKNLSPP